MKASHELKDHVTWDGKLWQVRGRSIWHVPPLYDLAEPGVVGRETVVKFNVPEGDIA